MILYVDKKRMQDDVIKMYGILHPKANLSTFRTKLELLLATSLFRLKCKLRAKINGTKINTKSYYYNRIRDYKFQIEDYEKYYKQISITS